MRVDQARGSVGVRPARPRAGGRASAVWAALALACWAPAAPAQQAGTIVAHLADGSNLPLTSWSLSYEYQLWQQGGPRFQAQAKRRSTDELWVGKKSYPVRGSVLEVLYAPARRPPEIDGATKQVSVQVARGLAWTGPGGKREELKPEPPHRDLIVPDADKKLLLLVRTLDLQGDTLTGTRYNLCIISFTSLVECPDKPGQQVVKVEFAP